MRCTLRGVLLILLQIQNMSMQKKSANKAEIEKPKQGKDTNLTFKIEITFRPQPLYNDAAINGAKMLDRFCLFIRSLSFLKRHDFHSNVEIFALHL